MDHSAKHIELSKMADIVACVVRSPRSSNVKFSAKEGDKCPYCDGLRSELHKAQQEILSYEKVIKVLQEELINMELRAQPYSRKQRDYYDEQFPSLQSKYDWI